MRHGVLVCSPPGGSSALDGGHSIFPISVRPSSSAASLYVSSSPIHAPASIRSRTARARPVGSMRLHLIALLALSAAAEDPTCQRSRARLNTRRERLITTSHFSRLAHPARHSWCNRYTRDNVLCSSCDCDNTIVSSDGHDKGSEHCSGAGGVWAPKAEDVLLPVPPTVAEPARDAPAVEAPAPEKKADPTCASWYTPNEI